jgi:hypothetical protein
VRARRGWKASWTKNDESKNCNGPCCGYYHKNVLKNLNVVEKVDMNILNEF